MKKRWLLLWCLYDQDTYRGHYNKTLEADTLEDAKKQAKDILDGIMLQAQFEFRLIELGAHDSGSRLWDRRAEPNKAEVDYTIKNYWEATDGG